MTTKIPVELSSTPGISDSSNATAITIDSSENSTFAGNIVKGNLTISDTEIDLSSGNLTLDVAGSIKLNADGGQIAFEDGSTEIGVFENSSSDFQMEAKVQDKDIKFVGNDGGSAITALSLDMSEQGSALFNNAIVQTHSNATHFFGGSTRSFGDTAGIGTAGGDNFHLSGSSSGDLVIAAATGKKMLFGTASSGISESMRITAAGLVCIGDTEGRGGSADAPKRLQLTGAESVMGIKCTTATDPSQRTAILFNDNGGTLRGFISLNNASTVYNTSSDYRLKEIIEPLSNGLDRLNQLNPVKFKWTDTGNIQEGFIAHEVQEIYPEAVSGEKDAVHEDGTLALQGMDYGRITPLLVKAIQEQQEQIEQLKAEVQTLKENK